MIKIDNQQKSWKFLCNYGFIEVHVIGHTRDLGLVQKRFRCELSGKRNQLFTHDSDKKPTFPAVFSWEIYLQAQQQLSTDLTAWTDSRRMT